MISPKLSTSFLPNYCITIHCYIIFMPPSNFNQYMPWTSLYLILKIYFNFPDTKMSFEMLYTALTKPGKMGNVYCLLLLSYLVMI